MTAQEHNDAFAAARSSFEEMLCWLEGTESAALTHAQLEDQVERRGREVQRLMLQDHLDLRSVNAGPIGQRAPVENDSAVAAG